MRRKVLDCVGLLCILSVGIPAVRGETHQYTPASYSREFTAEMAPALRIKPGDVVVTSCVDSNGDDASGKRVTTPYNPLTGPFYVEGAAPGDTLVVVLERVRLNRDTAVASTRMNLIAVPPEYVAKNPPSRGITWNLDRRTMTASVGFSPWISRFRLPLKPFPGCIGVAPPKRDAPYSPLMARAGSGISSITSDDIGGNLDYNRLVEGTTVYFPVHAPGAFFFIGDGHAAQGDGEVNGGALETSLDVQFRVSLLKGKSIPAVRAESEEYYMALGMGLPLNEALQRANANMIDWLTKDFALTREDAQVLIGTTVDYDIGVLSDLRSNVACKIRKSFLNPPPGNR